jgi:hypothetical protein
MLNKFGRVVAWGISKRARPVRTVEFANGAITPGNTSPFSFQLKEKITNFNLNIRRLPAEFYDKKK